jgi:hypothetical protein
MTDILEVGVWYHIPIINKEVKIICMTYNDITCVDIEGDKCSFYYYDGVGRIFSRVSEVRRLEIDALITANNSLDRLLE